MTPEQITNLIENEFIGWLKAKPNDEIVGRPANPKQCLLSKFLMENGIAVGRVWFTYLYLEDRTEVRIPKKIDSFIQILAYRFSGENDQPITAETALSYWVE